MTAPRRIDVHQHFVPPFWKDELPAHGGDPSGSAMPDWSMERALAFMDKFGIETAILSLSTPSLAGWRGDELVAMARRVNDFAAQLVSDHPRRFGFFATLPLPDIKASLTEINHAMDDLGADGVCLMSNLDGLYAADPQMAPVWAALDMREAVVFLHPSMPSGKSAEGVAGPLVDFPADTTRAAAQLVLGGTMDRYRNVEVILSHAGGFVPYAAQRFAELGRAFDPKAPSAEDALAAFKRFRFDTAISGYRPTIDALVEFAGVDRIVFGSDFPYVSEPVARTFVDELSTDLDDAAAAAVAGGNAETLFPRLAARPA